MVIRTNRKKLPPERAFRKIMLEGADLMRPAANKWIRRKLFNAYFTLLKRWLARITVNSDQTYSGPLDALALQPGMRELLGWIMPPRKSLSESEQESYRKARLQILIDAGTPTEEAVGYVSEWKREKRRGRAASLRFAAIDAYEDKLRRPKSWVILTERHCPCVKRPHDLDCRDALQREVRLLKLVLKKYRHPRKWNPPTEDLHEALRLSGLARVSIRRRLTPKTS